MACRTEAPYLTRFHRKYGDRGLQVIAVDADEKDAPDAVTDFARKKKLAHRILLGGSRAAEKYGFDKVFPTIFWIDHRGNVVRRETGFRPEMEKEIERTIEDLLGARDAEAGRSPAGGPRDVSTGSSEEKKT